MKKQNLDRSETIHLVEDMPEEDKPENVSLGEDRKGFFKWVKGHRKQILLVVGSVAAVILVILAIRNRKELAAFMEDLKEAVTKGSKAALKQVSATIEKYRSSLPSLLWKPKKESSMDELLLDKLKKGELDGPVGNPWTGGGYRKVHYTKYIKDGIPTIMKETDGIRWFDGKESERIPDIAYTLFDTDEKKLDFIGRYGFLLEDPLVKKYSALHKGEYVCHPA